jgi:P27 family predicted phage terminase small subunit
MARPKTSTEIKALSGTLRGDRIKEGIQFAAIIKVPKPEDWLSVNGKINFKRLAKMLIEKKMLFVSDVHLLAIMAEEMATYTMACHELIDVASYTQISPKGYEMQSPWVGIRNQSQANVCRIGSLFGLDPLSREKFGGSKSKEPENPFGKI